MKITMKCKCGAVGEGEGRHDDNGTGLPGGEMIDVVNVPSEWEGGDATCSHDDAEIISADEGDDGE